jgi:hypothetical protein
LPVNCAPARTTRQVGLLSWLAIFGIVLCRMNRVLNGDLSRVTSESNFSTEFEVVDARDLVNCRFPEFPPLHTHARALGAPGTNTRESAVYSCDLARARRKLAKVASARWKLWRACSCGSRRV